MSDSITDVALEMSSSSMGEQSRKLDELRARSVGLLGAGSVAVAFLGAQALRSGRFPYISVLAIAGFFAFAWKILSILKPIEGWKFRLSGQIVVGYWQGKSFDEAKASLIKRYEGNWQHNETLMKDLYEKFGTAARLLILDIAFWLLALVEVNLLG